MAAAEFLIERGVAVTKLAASLSAEPALERLAKGDFRLMTYTSLLNVEERHATLAFRYGGADIDVSADTVVFVSHNAPN